MTRAARSRSRVRALTLAAFAALACGAPPHLAWIVADDLGYADVGYHGAEFATPTLDALALSADGVRLEQYYVQQVCSPSRTAFMTGRYPIHTGFQHIVIWQDANATISAAHATVAEQLRLRGYASAMVGKWHNGHASWAASPLGRGFDRFYGWVGGARDDARRARRG